MSTSVQRSTETSLVSLDQLQDRMSSLVVANQQLEVTRDNERALEQERIVSTQQALHQFSGSNTSLEKQLLNLNSQLQANRDAVSLETSSDADLEKSEQDSLEHKSASAQQLLKQAEDLEQQIREIERKMTVQEEANRKGHTSEIDRKIVRAIAAARGW